MNLIHEFDLTALPTMTPRELWALHASLTTACGVLTGMCNEPRFDGPGLNYNKAGEALDSIVTWLQSMRGAIAQEAHARPSAGEPGDEFLAWTVMAHEVSFTDDLEAVAARIATAVRLRSTGKEAGK